mmetsp:Transcript_38331/g.122090  ORF Transcript_38331/g.122090 Transcript_38331/m.122090 type:complete len:216 (+) Transcript_38331:92-739(+)
MVRSLALALLTFCPGAASMGSLVSSRTNLPLGATGMNLSFAAVGTDRIKFTISLEKLTWIGFGLNLANETSMDGSGTGSDTVTCAGGKVERHWVTEDNITAGSLDGLFEASCSQVNGVTTMTFQRSLVANGKEQIEVMPGMKQMVIFAHGEPGATVVVEHHHEDDDQGGLLLDFADSGLAKLAQHASGAVSASAASAAAVLSALCLSVGASTVGA